MASCGTEAITSPYLKKHISFATSPACPDVRQKYSLIIIVVPIIPWEKAFLIEGQDGFDWKVVVNMDHLPSVCTGKLAPSVLAPLGIFPQHQIF